MSTPRFYSLITKDKDLAVGFDLQKVRITFETIEAVREDGRYVVLGIVLATTGNRIYTLGERVPVVWQTPQGAGEPVPVAIFGHNFRRTQGIIPSAIVAVGPLEVIQLSSIQPPPVEDPETGEPVDPPPVEAFVIFSQAGQFALQPEHEGLNPAPEIDPETGEPDPEAPPEQTVRNLGAAWGENGNHILLRFRIEGDEDDPLDEVPQIQAFKINRTPDSKKIPLKKDAEKKTVIVGANELGEGGIPAVDGELLGERVVEFDPEMLLKREEFPGSTAELVQLKLKVTENVIFRTFTEIEFSEVGEEFGVFPGTGGVQTINGAGLDEPPPFSFQQEHVMTLDGVNIGGDNGAYKTTLLSQFLNKENEIIQIFNIAWFIQRFFDFEEDIIDPETGDPYPNGDKKLTLFAPSTNPVGTPESFPSIKENLQAAGFFLPTTEFPEGDPNDLPNLNQGFQIANTFFGRGILSEPEPRFNLDAVFFEPASFVFVFPSFNWLQEAGEVATHFDIFAMKRDTSDAEEKKDLIIAASFEIGSPEDTLELSYDRTIDFNMSAIMVQQHLRQNLDGATNFGPPHSEHLMLFQRHFFPFDIGSVVPDGSDLPFPENLNAISGEGMRYFTDIVPEGGNLFIDQLHEDEETKRPEGLFFHAKTISNIKFTGRSKFGDPNKTVKGSEVTGFLRPNVPNVFKEVEFDLKVFGTTSGINEFGLSGGAGGFDESTINRPDNSFTVKTFALEAFEDFEGEVDNEPLFTLFTTRSGTMDPLLNKNAFVVVGEKRKQRDPAFISSDGFFRNILRWDFSNEDEVDKPIQVMRTRESGEGPFDDNQVISLIAHDGAIFARFAIFGGDERIVLDADGEGKERFFAPFPDPVSGEDLEPEPGFRFILPGRGTPRLISESYTSLGRARGTEEFRFATRSRIFRITISESFDVAEIRITTKPPNSDITNLNPKVSTIAPVDSASGGPSYRYAGVK